MKDALQTRKKGFTLVELIVVIAIIAILGAVLIPSFTRFIDDGRFSNDVSRAASMTTILKGYRVEHEESLEAYGVRQIINEYHGSPFDYTPEASNTGFFYLENSNKIVALKYEDAGSYEELSLNEALLLSDTDLEGDETFSSPEELFGEGKRLMTKDGSPVALAVSFIYELANTGSVIEASYKVIDEKLEDYTTETLIGKMLNLFGYGLSDEVVGKLENLIDEYDPSKTLFVNNVGWSTTATDAGSIKKIVFAPGISNIPEFDVDEDIIDNEQFDDITLPLGHRVLPWSPIDNEQFDDITLPRTVKTIESGAFTAFSSLNTITTRGTGRIGVESNAFGGTVNMQVSLDDYEPPLLDDQGLITYTGLTIDLQDFYDHMASDNIIVTGLKVEIDLDVPENSRIYVYTKDGLIGYIIPIENIE